MRRALLATCLVGSTLGFVAAADANATPRVTHQVVRSFDGTPIYTTFFLPSGASSRSRVPAVLRGAGWGSRGETAYAGTLKTLVDAGYAVLTWDARGFGRSGGTPSVDALDVEGRDVSALIDWVATRPMVASQRRGDPVVGMSGPSYGGAIQLAAAAIDHRIDAIAPEISWFDLRYSLFPNGIAKRGSWADLLFASGFADRRASPDWLLARSVAGYGETHPIAAPTLVMQGTVDELFNLNEGVRIAGYLAAHRVPHRFVAFCGGHGTCRHPGDDRAHLDDAIVRWFDRWLRGRTDVDVGPPAEYRTNSGRWRAATDFPPPDTSAARGVGAGVTPLTASVVTAPANGLDVVGLPHASIDLNPASVGATLYLELVDRESGEVLANQGLPLPARTSHVEAELVGVVHTLAPGHHLDVRVTADRTVAGLSVVVTAPVRPTA